MSYNQVGPQLREAVEFHAAVADILAKRSPGKYTDCVTALAAATDLLDRLARGGQLHDAADNGGRALLELLHLIEQSSLAGSGPASRRRRCSPRHVADILILADRLP